MTKLSYLYIDANGNKTEGIKAWAVAKAMQALKGGKIVATYEPIIQICKDPVLKKRIAL